MARKKFKVLSFKEQDCIFHRIFSEPMFLNLPEAEESLRPTKLTSSPTEIDNYFLTCRWYLSFTKDIAQSDLIKLIRLLPTLYLSNFQRVYPDFVNLYTLRIIDFQFTSNSVDILIVIDNSEAHMRNLL